MASPVVQEAIESSTNTAGTSHVVTLPTATAGQLLLIILDKGSTAATIDAHASLTELLDENSANGLYIAYRWMDGTEPASYTLTSSASTRTARIAYRISGAENPATQAPQIGTTATGTSATPDPPASATPGGSKDYLFIAFYGAAGEEADDDTWSDTPPSNYSPTPPRQKACGTAGTNLGGMIAAAERALTTGSAENPGTFAKDVSAAWRAQTIMIHPVAPVTHATTGALSGAAATVAGSASSATTRASSGSLTGGPATIAGSAARTREHPVTGVLSGAGAQIVGAADRQAPSFVTHATTGTMIAGAAAISGSAERSRTFDAAGVLVGAGAVIDGVGNRFRAHASSGVVSGAGAIVDGSAERSTVTTSHDASGELAGAGAAVEGSASAGVEGGWIFKREKYYRKVEDEEEQKPPKAKVVRLVKRAAERALAGPPVVTVEPLRGELKMASLDFRPSYEELYWKAVSAEIKRRKREIEIDDEEAIILFM